MRIIFSILLFAAIAFGIAYYFFAQVGDGQFISLKALFFDRNVVGEFILKFGGIDLEAIRTKILISTGVGAVLGAIVGASSQRR